MCVSESRKRRLFYRKSEDLSRANRTASEGISRSAASDWWVLSPSHISPLRPSPLLKKQPDISFSSLVKATPPFPSFLRRRQARWFPSLCLPLPRWEKWGTTVPRRRFVDRLGFSFRWQRGFNGGSGASLVISFPRLPPSRRCCLRRRRGDVDVDSFRSARTARLGLPEGGGCRRDGGGIFRVFFFPVIPPSRRYCSGAAGSPGRVRARSWPPW